MTFQSGNDDVFLLCEQLTALGAVSVTEVRQSNSNPLACKIAYRPSGASSIMIELTWNSISAKRMKAGDAVDMSLVIKRQGESLGKDILDLQFSVDPDSIYDPDFAAVAAASFRCINPEQIEGVELLLANEFGIQHGIPIAVGAIGHGATGYQFAAKPGQASILVRFHLKQSQGASEKLSLRLGRVFFGLQYDPYVFNPWYEHSAFVNNIKRTTGFKEIAAAFVKAARAESRLHKFSASQSFIMPFEVIREGRPAFPMLCGTINSLYWYAMTPAHGVEEYEDSGFIKPGDVVMDCGAHAGQMTALFGRIVGKSGKIIAFEPFPQNFLQVEAQAKLNKLTGFKSARAGVGETHEKVKVPNAVQMILADSFDHGLKDHVEINIAKIDDYIDLKPTAIKLDIEGAEVAAMRGAQRVLRECRPKVLCEFHTQLVGQFGHTVQDFFDAIPLELYDVTYSEEGKDGSWHIYTGSEKQEWTMPGTIKAFPKNPQQH